MCTCVCVNSNRGQCQRPERLAWIVAVFNESITCGDGTVTLYRIFTSKTISNHGTYE